MISRSIFSLLFLLHISLVFTEDIEKIASLRKTVSKIGNAGMAVINIISPSNPGSATRGALQRMFLHSRYLNVSKTDRLEAFYLLSDPDSDYFIPMPKISQSFKETAPSYSLPYMFAKYDLHSNFLVNFGENLISFFIYFGAFFIFYVVDKINKYLRNIGAFRRVISYIKIVIGNYLLSQFYELFGEIIFFSITDLRVFDLNDGADNLAFLGIISCLVLGIAFLISQYWVLYKYQKAKTSKSELAKFKKKFEGAQLFYEDFVDHSLNHQGYLFFSCIRNIIFYVVLALLPESPLPQILLIKILSVWMLIYLVFRRPIKSKIELIQQISFEFSFLAVNVSSLIMAAIDANGYNWTNTRKNTSEIIIVFNMIFTFLPLAFFAVRIVLVIWELYHWYKDYLKGKKKVKPIFKFEKGVLDEIVMTEGNEEASCKINYNSNQRGVTANNYISTSETERGLRLEEGAIPSLESFHLAYLKKRKKRRSGNINFNYEGVGGSQHVMSMGLDVIQDYEDEHSKTNELRLDL